MSCSCSLCSTDNLALPKGDTGADGNDYNQLVTSLDWNASATVTGGVDNRFIFMTNLSAGATTTGNRIITLTPGLGDNYFVIKLDEGLTVGTGFTWLVKDAAGTTLLTLTEGSQLQKEYEFVYDGSAYKPAFEKPSYYKNTAGEVKGVRRMIKAVYDFASVGGGVGTITLPYKIPAGSLVYPDKAVISTQTILASGSVTTVSIGLSGLAVDTIDSNRNHSTYPYSTLNAVAHAESFASATTDGASAVTINAKRGKIFIDASDSMTAAAYGNDNFTLTNSFINANTQVDVELMDYSGTYATNGIPVPIAVQKSTGSCVIRVQNLHNVNALNGTATLFFNVTGERATSVYNVVRLASAASVTVTIGLANLTAGKFYVYIPYDEIAS